MIERLNRAGFLRDDVDDGAGVAIRLDRAGEFGFFEAVGDECGDVFSG